MTENKSFRIIVIDDNPAINQDFIKILIPKDADEELDALDSALFDSGSHETKVVLPHFRIDTASQGEEGIEMVRKAKEEGNPYSLAFVDIRMPPGLDGVETIKLLWKIAPDLEVVICTAYSDYGWEETVDELGIRDNLLILKKPFDAIAVRQLACSLTRKWQLMQEIQDHTINLEQKVTERTESLEKSLSLTRATLDSSIDGVLAVNNEGQIVDFNLRLMNMWGFQHEDASNITFETIIGHMKECLENANESELTLYHKKEYFGQLLHLKDGRVFEMYTHPQTINGQVVGQIWSFRDITKRVELEGKLEFQATHDPLTNLPNRLLLVNRVEQAIFTAKRHHSKLAVLFFDLDRFKYINDSLGHEVGDDLLTEVANSLRSITREEDIIARIGGDEFVMVLTDIHDRHDISTVADKILAMFSKPFSLGHREMYVTSSVGISVYPDDGSDIEELMKNADLAMYNSKASGSNKYSFYSTELSKQAEIALEMEGELRKALINNEFFLVYQPQCDISKNQCTSLEALIRWKHPLKGIVPPTAFIPFAEDSGLIVPIGEWVLRTACKQCREWQDMGLEDLKISVNVATAQLRKENFVGLVADILNEYKLAPHCLEVEITENVIYSDERTMETINNLKKIGVQIALDDFGSGHSSLTHLKLLNVDRVKIDQSFIKNINIDRSDEVIIQSIIDMAKSLGFSVTAEGVETYQQQKFIEDRNCDGIQGYHFGKPMIAEDLTAYLMEEYKLVARSSGT